MQRVEVAEKFIAYEQKRAAERQKATQLIGRGVQANDMVPDRGKEPLKGEALDLAAKKVNISSGG